MLSRNYALYLRTWLRFVSRHKLASCLAILLTIDVIVISARLLQKDPVYESHVLPENCALCGEGNIYRGADTMALVTTHYWNIRNIGVKSFCSGIDSSDLEHQCSYDWTNDDYLSEEELAHKYAPLDINGKLKEEPTDNLTCYLNILSNDEHNGSTGGITIRQKQGVVYGNLKIDSLQQAQNDDREHLSTILCPGCYEKVLAVTDKVDFFLMDCKTLDIFPMYKPEWDFYVGDYRVEIQYTSRFGMGFLAFYDPNHEIKY